MDMFNERDSFKIMFTTYDFPVEDMVSFMSRICGIYGVYSCKFYRDRVSSPAFRVVVDNGEISRIKGELLAAADECIGHGIVKCH